MTAGNAISVVLPVWSLFVREVLRFVRQRNRIVGALGTPLLFWVLLGGGFGRSFSPPGLEAGMNYLSYFFPGTLMLVVLFTAIFSSISIIEDRKDGFLQGVLVAPVPRLSIVAGKVLGGTVLAVVQGLLLLALAPLAGVHVGWLHFLAAAGVLALTAMALSALGFLGAWRTDSVQGFHAVMNLLLMPMWLLSGALFPATGASPWVRAVMAVNPLTYGLAALRRVLYGPAIAARLGDPAPATALLVLCAFVVLLLALAVRMARRGARV